MTVTNRPRIRDLGIQIGVFPPGKHNAITDVEGVLVGHQTIIRDAPFTARTGVTAVVPRSGAVHLDHAFAGYFSFNGIGEMTGLPLIDEWGTLTSPVLLTNTNQVGLVRESLVRYGTKKHGGFAYKLPVVAETYDGYLNDIDAFPVTEEDVFAALDSAAGGPVEEGSVGGGTGMICYEFKGGIGTASRLVDVREQTYTVGALVQANHGARRNLLVNGVPVGQELTFERIPGPQEASGAKGHPSFSSSSIIVVVATDAPLLSDQCKRLARRATVGLARTGGMGYNTSGDIFLAFATGNHYDSKARSAIPLTMLHQSLMNPLIEATTEAVEEAILNVLVAAYTMTGYLGRTVSGLPGEALTSIMKQYNR